MDLDQNNVISPMLNICIFLNTQFRKEYLQITTIHRVSCLKFFNGKTITRKGKIMTYRNILDKLWNISYTHMQGIFNTRQCTSSRNYNRCIFKLVLCDVHLCGVGIQNNGIERHHSHEVFFLVFSINQISPLSFLLTYWKYE